MPGQKERPLELSDLASELNQEILVNPYKFLGLPETASIAEARQTYISLSRRYHPDMIKPGFDTPDLFTDPVLKTIAAEWQNIALEDIPGKIKEILASVNSQDPQEQERRSLALKAIQTAAHEKMVRINIAYEAIKNRVDPKRWNSPLGYEHVQQYNPAEKDFEQEIKLEANAELTLYPNAYEYWVPGAYLEYDWGPVPDHEWYDEEIFRECTVVKISPVLLDTFFGNFC